MRLIPMAIPSACSRQSPKVRRADRLFQIVQFLRGGRLVTARSLAEKLEVSERTIYRDMADLIGSGVPIDGEAGVGYLLRAGFDVPPLMFTRDEVAALVAGARLIRAFGGAAMARASEEALIKIAAVLPEAGRAAADEVPIHAFQIQSDPALRDRIDALDRMVTARLRVEMTYQDAGGAESTRTVRPLGLWFWGRTWTLVAWCELRQDFRMFRLDRMTAFEEGAPFRPERDKSLSAALAALHGAEC
jgi:predicted DNA-binding transcriptional regulator YafY